MLKGESSLKNDCNDVANFHTIHSFGAQQQASTLANTIGKNSNSNLDDVSEADLKQASYMKQSLVQKANLQYHNRHLQSANQFQRRTLEGSGLGLGFSQMRPSSIQNKKDRQ
jgi:hypothetical protein